MEHEKQRLRLTDLIFDGIEKIGSEYDFTVLTASRALQIQAGLMPFSRSGGKGSLEMAMEEIIEGKVEIRPTDEEPSLE